MKMEQISEPKAAEHLDRGPLNVTGQSRVHPQRKQSYQEIKDLFAA
jgi:hypothetical protein